MPSTAEADFGGDQITFNLTGGHDFKFDRWTLSPFAGLAYSYLWVDGYSESGAGILNLNVDDQTADSLISQLGARVSYTWTTSRMTFIPELRASWNHEFLQESRRVNARLGNNTLGSFVIDTADPERDYALVGGGITAVLDETVSILLDYDVQFGQRDFIGHSFSGGFRFSF